MKINQVWRRFETGKKNHVEKNTRKRTRKRHTTYQIILLTAVFLFLRVTLTGFETARFRNQKLLCGVFDNLECVRKPRKGKTRK